MEYDALGRLTKGWATDRPKASNPSSPSVSNAYAVHPDKPSSVTTTSLTSSGTVDSFALFDGLGRQVQTQAPVVGGGAVITDTEYDSAGREWASNKAYWAPAVTPGTTLFVPSTLNQISTRTETLFDGAGRATVELIRSFGAEIRRTTTTYRGDDRVDTTPPAGGIPTSTSTDAWGRTSKLTQWMGAIDGPGIETVSLQYQYNARGQLVHMTDDDTNVWTWSFDQRGRQIGSTDPDAGAQTSTYDDLGNLVSSTDARNVTRAYTYDALNRKTTERSGSATGTVLASWTYDTLAKSQLTSASRFASGLEYKSQVTGYDNAYRPDRKSRFRQALPRSRERPIRPAPTTTQTALSQPECFPRLEDFLPKNFIRRTTSSGVKPGSAEPSVMPAQSATSRPVKLLRSSAPVRPGVL